MGCFKFFSVKTFQLLSRSNILQDLLHRSRGFSRFAKKRDMMLLDVKEQLSNRLDVFGPPAFVLAEVDRDVLLLDE
jgi:hypothetical protein